MTARKIGPGAWRDYGPSEFGSDAHRTRETYRPVSGDVPRSDPRPGCGTPCPAGTDSG